MFRNFFDGDLPRNLHTLVMSHEFEGVSALVDKDDMRQWVALTHDTEGTLLVFRITDEDAWDFDIEKRLQIRIRPVSESFCKILSKSRVL